MKITPQQFLDFLVSVDAVSVDEGPLLTSWNTAPITGALTNEVAAFDWTDSEYDYFYRLTEGAINEGEFINNVFISSAEEENDTCIRFYTLTQIAPNL